MPRRPIEFPRALKIEIALLPVELLRAIHEIVKLVEEAQTDDGFFTGVVTSPGPDGLNYVYRRGVFVSFLFLDDVITVVDAGTYLHGDTGMGRLPL